MEPEPETSIQVITLTQTRPAASLTSPPLGVVVSMSGDDLSSTRISSSQDLVQATALASGMSLPPTTDQELIDRNDREERFQDRCSSWCDSRPRDSDPTNLSGVLAPSSSIRTSKSPLLPFGCVLTNRWKNHTQVSQTSIPALNQVSLPDQLLPSTP